MPTIVGLQGKPQIGKSTTLTIFRRLLLSSGYTAVPGKYQLYGGDFIDQFTQRGRTIGISSEGDTYDVITTRLDLLLADGCDIIFTTCRTNGYTLDAIYEYPTCVKLFTYKEYISNPKMYLRVNTADANLLLQIANQLIK